MCSTASANREVRENDSAETLVESSPKGETQSKGIAERAVQDLDDGVRTHKLDLEAKLQTTVRIGSPLHCVDGGERGRHH